MKIEESNQQATINLFRNEKVEQIAGKDGKPADAVNPPNSGRDKVDLSPTVERLNKATSSQELPEFRADRVADLKAKIEAGEYKVSGREIAEGMLTRLKKGHTA